MGSPGAIFEGLEAIAKAATAMAEFIFSSKSVGEIAGTAATLKATGKNLTDIATALAKNGAPFDKLAVALKSIDGTPDEIAAAIKGAGGSYNDIGIGLKMSGASDTEITAALRVAKASDKEIADAIEAAKKEKPSVDPAAKDAGAAAEAKPDPATAGRDGFFTDKQWKKIEQQILERKPLTPAQLAKMSPEQDARAIELGARAERLGKPVDTRGFMRRHPIWTFIGLSAASGVATGVYEGAINTNTVLNQIPDAASAAYNTARGLIAGAEGDEEAKKKFLTQAAKDAIDLAAVDTAIYNKVKGGVSGLLSWILGDTIAGLLGGWVATAVVAFGKPLIHGVFKSGYNMFKAGAGRFGLDASTLPDIDPEPALTLTDQQKWDMRVFGGALDNNAHAIKAYLEQHHLAELDYFKEGGKTYGNTVIAMKRLLQMEGYYNGSLSPDVTKSMVAALADFAAHSKYGQPMFSSNDSKTMLATLEDAAGIPRTVTPDPAARDPHASPARLPQGQVPPPPQITSDEMMQFVIGARVTGHLEDISTIRAIEAYQRKIGTEVTGQLDLDDPKTQAALDADLTKLEQQYSAGKTPQQAGAALMAAIVAKKTADQAALAAQGARGAASPDSYTPGDETAPGASPPKSGPETQKKTPVEPSLIDKLDGLARGFNDSLIKALTFGYADRNKLGGLVDSLAAGDIDWRTGNVLHIDENAEKERQREEDARNAAGSAYKASQAAGYVGGAMVGGVDIAAIGAVKGATLLGSTFLAKMAAVLGILGTDAQVSGALAGEPDREQVRPLATPKAGKENPPTLEFPVGP